MVWMRVWRIMIDGCLNIDGASSGNGQLIRLSSFLLVTRRARSIAARDNVQSGRSSAASLGQPTLPRLRVLMAHNLLHTSQLKLEGSA
jgi:hypothetical protein